MYCIRITITSSASQVNPNHHATINAHAHCRKGTTPNNFNNTQERRTSFKEVRSNNTTTTTTRSYPPYSASQYHQYLTHHHHNRVLLPTLAWLGAAYVVGLYVSKQLHGGSDSFDHIYAQQNTPEVEQARKRDLMVETYGDPRNSLLNILGWTK